MKTPTAREIEARAESFLQRRVPTGEVSPRFFDANHPEQRAFLADASRFKGAFCTRRAGKSFGVGLHLFRDAWEEPDVKCVFIAKTLKSAKGIIWNDILKVINARLGLNAKPNYTELTWTLPNGSQIKLVGADDPEEMEKLLGQKYKTVAIDEGEAFRNDIKHLIYSVLMPAVADRRGTIILTGTPSNLKAGLFFEMTNGQDASEAGRWQFSDTSHGVVWSWHKWSAFQNPHMAAQWREEISSLRAVNPRIDETPFFQQNYLGRWAIDDSKLVYRYRPGFNDFGGVLPKYAQGKWVFGLGVDLGFNDATSFNVAAYHPHDPRLYFLKAFKESGLDITATAQRIKALQTAFEIGITVVDGANKQAVEELNNRHGIVAVAADKTGKADFIDIMNAEFLADKIKLGPDCEALKEEYANLIWDERALDKLKRVEHPACHNHCADGSLYIWRWCYQYLSKELAPAVKPNTAEWLAEEAKRQQRELDEMIKKGFEENRQRREWNEDQSTWI